MADILSRILDTKRREVQALLVEASFEEWRRRAGAAAPARDFAAALAGPGAVRLIAEVKRASPSRGVLREHFDAVEIARAYERGGAACLSVLTDREYFQGDIAYLSAIKAAVALPVLRKDFILHPVQVLESRAAGADAILLIAAALEPATLAILHLGARELGLAVLVEVHDEADLARVREARVAPALLGINNRDLRSFEVRLETTTRLARAVDWPAVIVAESGIFTPGDVETVAMAGARAVLVGESLVREPDVEAATRRLLGLERR